jgi:hypothetical protein
LISLKLSKDEYFLWLLQQVGAEGSYMNLCGQLYKTKFKWFIPNDDNRMNDGFELRNQYLELESLGINELDNDILFSDCSVLEVLIGLCHRVSFDSVLSVDDCFWEFIHNLDLQNYTDTNYNESSYNQIAKKVSKFINRKYLPDGTGGLFPLKNPRENQQKVELWFQMSAYLIENDLIT